MKAPMPRVVDVLAFFHSNSTTENAAINLSNHKIRGLGSYKGRICLPMRGIASFFTMGGRWLPTWKVQRRFWGQILFKNTPQSAFALTILASLKATRTFKAWKCSNLLHSYYIYAEIRVCFVYSHQNTTTSHRFVTTFCHDFATIEFSVMGQQNFRIAHLDRH